MKSCGSLLPPLYRLLSPLGPLLLAGRGGWLSGLWFEGERHCPTSHQAEARPQCIALEWDGAHAAVANLPPFVETTLQWLRAYFSGFFPLPPLPDLDLRGTPFQLAVWRELLDVPFATTLSYGALALRVAHRWPHPSVGVRAVAGAVGRNPVSILVPCHRCRVTGLWARAVRSGAMPAEWSARWRCWHTRESGATAAAWRTVTGFLAALRSRRRGVPAAGFCCGDCARKSGCSLSAPAPGHNKSPRDLSIVRGFVFHLGARRRYSAAAVRGHQTTPCAIMALATFMKPATLAPRT